VLALHSALTLRSRRYIDSLLEVDMSVFPFTWSEDALDYYYPRGPIFDLTRGVIDADEEILRTYMTVFVPKLYGRCASSATPRPAALLRSIAASPREPKPSRSFASLYRCLAARTQPPRSLASLTLTLSFHPPPPLRPLRAIVEREVHLDLYGELRELHFTAEKLTRDLLKWAILSVDARCGADDRCGNLALLSCGGSGQDLGAWGGGRLERARRPRGVAAAAAALLRRKRASERASGGDPPNPPCGRRGRTYARSHMCSVAHVLALRSALTLRSRRYFGQRGQAYRDGLFPVFEFFNFPAPSDP
jgi:hypothetical protein